MTALSSELVLSGQRRAEEEAPPSRRMPAALFQQAVVPAVSVPKLPATRSAMSQSTSTQSTPSASISRTILVAQPSSTMSGLRSAYCASAPILEEPSAFIRSSAWYYAASRMRSPKATRSAISAVSSKKPVPSAPHRQRAKWSKPPCSNLPAAEPSTGTGLSTPLCLSKAPIRQTLPDPKSFGLTSGKRPTVGDTVSKLSQSGAEICRTRLVLLPCVQASGERAASQPPSSQGASPRASHKRQARWRRPTVYLLPGAKRRAVLRAFPGFAVPAALHKRQASALASSSPHLPGAKRRAEQLLSSRDGVPAASIGAA